MCTNKQLYFTKIDFCFKPCGTVCPIFCSELCAQMNLNSPLSAELKYIHIYAYMHTHKYMYLYIFAHIYYMVVHQNSPKSSFWWKKHNLTDMLSKTCDLFGKEGLNFLNLKQNPKVNQFRSGRRAGCTNTLHSCSNENTEYLNPQSQESPCSLYSTEVLQSVWYTCIF